MKHFCLIVLTGLAFTMAARAVVPSVGGVTVLPIELNATTNVTAVATNDYQTNYVLLHSPVTVTGSTVAGVNGTYTLSFSNNAAGHLHMLWTNHASSKLMEYRFPEFNDFGDNFSIESSTDDYA